ncbi:hypothetical protein [Falsiroseomonas sp. E2-1-a20]|uniref:hypothetical protein n=1 Tax=Falsiroseomonas sp. E2-1-a20 TaxID=3239300 RepID=UPI003F3D3758
MNIQLEHGTLGLTMPQILRRFRWLVRAAPALSVTFHTILDEARSSTGQLSAQLRSLKLASAAMTIADHARSALLAHGVYRELHRQQSRKPVRIITHTRRDMRLLRDVRGLTEVHHHPLSFVAPAQAAEIRAAATREAFPILKLLPPGAKLIGTFGFLSPYKGFETAVEALRYLPADHHLLVFGGIHPQAIARGLARDPYISKLLAQGHIGQTALEALRANGATSLAVDGSARELLAPHPQDLHQRLHFMGVLEDSQFMSAMALCDSVVVPYLEVGQSSSGPIAMALEMGCRVIASRTRAFLQYARYHPDRIEFFDIGNFAELARRIEAGPPPAPADRRLTHDTTSNAALYLKVSLPPGMAPPGMAPSAQRAEPAEAAPRQPVAVA